MKKFAGWLLLCVLLVGGATLNYDPEWPDDVQLADGATSDYTDAHFTING